MPSFLVESYLAAGPALLEDARSRARRAAELSEGVRYLRTVFVPGDETCFHLLEAPSTEAELEPLEGAVGLSGSLLSELSTTIWLIRGAVTSRSFA